MYEIIYVINAAISTFAAIYFSLNNKKWDIGWTNCAIQLWVVTVLIVLKMI